jgi:hypothetical protein
LSAVSTYETDLAVLGREDFWLIVAFRGSEDETGALYYLRACGCGSHASEAYAIA